MMAARGALLRQSRGALAAPTDFVPSSKGRIRRGARARLRRRFVQIAVAGFHFYFGARETLRRGAVSTP